MRAVPWLLVVGACGGWSERRFEAVGIERLCAAAAACAGTYDAATCVDHLRTTDRSGCDYDPVAAEACAKAAEDAACVQVEPFELFELAIPEPCHQAYGCPWIDLSAL